MRVLLKSLTKFSYCYSDKGIILCPPTLEPTPLQAGRGHWSGNLTGIQDLYLTTCHLSYLVLVIGWFQTISVQTFQPTI